MKIIKLPTLVYALLMTSCVSVSHAASISFDAANYVAGPGDTLTFDVVYDFTDLPIFGMGFNLVYDPTVMEFAGYTHPVWGGGVGEPQSAVSPAGMLESPGNYNGVGIGTFDFAGIYTAGTFGTFTFNILGGGGDAACGGFMCLTPDPDNPAADLLGNNVTDIIFANGITVATNVLPFPIPGAAWLMLSGLGALLLSRKKLRS